MSMDARKALEDFIVDNSDLERLEDMLAEFNFLEVLGVSKSENRHSRFLAWLLDPRGTHGLGDYFLRRFLLRVTSYARSCRVAGTTALTAFDVDQWKLRDVTAETERHRIDILVSSEEDGFLCAIENKVFSGEHGNQLRRYRQMIERDYARLAPLYVLLTVEGRSPANEEDATYYIPISYHQVADLIQQVLSARASNLGVNVLGALQQYITALRRHILADSDIQELARQIYRKHKAAIDLIFEARPDAAQEIRDIIESIITQYPQLQPDISSKSFVRYYPQAWEQIPKLREGKGWTETGRMLLFEFRNAARSLSLHLVLGPGTEEVRRRLHSLARQGPELFTVSKSFAPKWNSLYRKVILNSSDYDEPDMEVIAEKVHKAISQFMGGEYDRLVEAVEHAMAEVGPAHGTEMET